MKSWSLRIAFAVVILVLVGFLAVILQPSSVTVPLPSPNGYDDFVAAAAAVLEDNVFADYRQWTAQELTKHVAASSNAFALVRAGLQKECRAPVVRAGDELEARMTKLASFKRLAFALAARSRLAMVEGRTNDAVEACLDGVQVAHGIARGGVLIEALVGFACENIALQSLSGVTIPNLDAATARTAALRLAELDARAPTIAETLASEHAFARSHGLYGTFIAAADRFGFGPLASSKQRFESKWTTTATRRRALILQLARRAFELEKGYPLTNDAELVPGVLTTLPVIPQLNTNLATRAIWP